MKGLQTTAPENESALRSALYRGELFLLSPNRASQAFSQAARALLHDTFGSQPRHIHQQLDPAAVFAGVGAMRRAIYLRPHYHSLLRQVIASLGFGLDQIAFDPARLRTVLHDGHQNPAARSAYFPHRDTWYANPQATITCWLPLHDLSEQETFVFSPDDFTRALPNDSAQFDYDRWVQSDWSRKIGWQDIDTGRRAHYPTARSAGQAPVAARGDDELGFSCCAASILLFSGAHFHRTLPQSSGLTRFSLDFRFAHLDDVRLGRGAPNVDNRSRGSCLQDYVHPGAPWPPAHALIASGPSS